MVDTLDFTVYGMKIQPGGAEEGTDPFEFCKSEEIIGVGWPIDRDREYSTLDEVHEQHQKKADRRAKEGKDTEEILADGRLNAPLRYVLKEMDEGDFVWVNEKNQFVLCKVASDWQVTPNLPDGVADDYDKRDIQHFRKVEWVDVPYSFVPGYVRRRFSRQTGTAFEMKNGINTDSKQVLQALHTRSGDNGSELSVNREAIVTKIDRAPTDRVFDILGPGETEDIVISYLQSLGWRVIKSSTNESEAKIECEMRTEEEGESVVGYLQVRTGSAGLDPRSYREYADAGQMIFFVQSGIDVNEWENMSSIHPKEIQEYIVSDYNYLPVEPLLKLDFSLGNEKP